VDNFLFDGVGMMDLRKGRAAWRPRAEIDVIMWIDRDIAAKAAIKLGAELMEISVKIYTEAIVRKDRLIQQLMDRILELHPSKVKR